MSVFAPSLSSLWRQIEEYGSAPEPLFKKYGIQGSTLFDPNARVPYALIDRVAAEAAQQSRDPFFGLKEARYFLPSHIGPLGFAWLASTSLRSALERLHRYANVIHDKTQIELSVKKDSLAVLILVDASSANAFQRDCASLAILARMCRFICGEDWNPTLISLAHPSPTETFYFYEFFRCPVEFDAEQNGFHVNRQNAEKRLTGANKQLAQLNDHVVVRYLAARSKGDIVNRVKTAILEGLGQGSVTEHGIAEELHMSPRTLNRKLVAANTSFKALLLEIRTELADQYINDATLTLTEISYMLGFSEVSSFSRAYKRWTGQTPSEARRSAL